MKTHPDPGQAAPRRGSRPIVDVAILTGALLALVAATLAARWAWTTAPGPQEQVSCAPYGLEDVSTAPRGGARPLSTGPVLSGGLRWAEGT